MPGYPVIEVYYETGYGVAPATKECEIDWETTSKFILTEEYFPTLSAEGHTFVGWSYNGELVENKYLELLHDELSSYPTLVAVWDVAPEEPTPPPYEGEHFVLASMTQLQNLADAIRAKSGGIESMTIDEMPEKIGELGSGSSIDTCTVWIDCFTNATECFALCMRDNKPTIVYADIDKMDWNIFEDVICGSYIFVTYKNTSICLDSMSVNCETLIHKYPTGVFKITAPAGGLTKIYLYNSK